MAALTAKARRLTNGKATLKAGGAVKGVAVVRPRAVATLAGRGALRATAVSIIGKVPGKVVFRVPTLLDRVDWSKSWPWKSKRRSPTDYAVNIPLGNSKK